MISTEPRTARAFETLAAVEFGWRNLDAPRVDAHEVDDALLILAIAAAEGQVSLDDAEEYLTVSCALGIIHVEMRHDLDEPALPLALKRALCADDMRSLERLGFCNLPGVFQ